MIKRMCILETNSKGDIVRALLLQCFLSGVASQSHGKQEQKGDRRKKKQEGRDEQEKEKQEKYEEQ